MVEWVANEFGGDSLNDRRLSTHLVKSVALLASHPGQKINADSRSDRTAINAFYRLIDMPEESAVTVENILAPHRERSIQRIRGQGKETETVLMLMIQDGTALRFATRPGCDGLQVVGRNQTSAKTLGLHLHATLAVSSEGLPLGVLRMGFVGVERKETAERGGWRPEEKAVQNAVLEGRFHGHCACDAGYGRQDPDRVGVRP